MYISIFFIYFEFATKYAAIYWILYERFLRIEGCIVNNFYILRQIKSALKEARYYLVQAQTEQKFIRII